MNGQAAWIFQVSQLVVISVKILDFKGVRILYLCMINLKNKFAMIRRMFNYFKNLFIKKSKPIVGNTVITTAAKAKQIGFQILQ